MKGQLARICSFATESEMGENLLAAITPRMRFNQVVIKREFRGPQGTPDFLLFRKCDSSLVYVVALELKLRDWRKGIFQAFKYRSFSNSAYVIVDHYYRNEAFANIHMFVDSNIGLASFSLEGELIVIHEPTPDMPYSCHHSLLLEKMFVRQELSTIKKCRFHRSRIGAVALGQLI